MTLLDNFLPRWLRVYANFFSPAVGHLKRSLSCQNAGLNQQLWQIFKALAKTPEMTPNL